VQRVQSDQCSAENATDARSAGHEEAIQHGRIGCGIGLTGIDIRRNRKAGLRERVHVNGH